YRNDMLLAGAMVAAGLAMSGISAAELLNTRHQPMAQATQPLASSPGAPSKPSAPAEPATTGTRPGDVPPEPARPKPEAQKAGAEPALPPAPAAKMAAATRCRRRPPRKWRRRSRTASGQSRYFFSFVMGAKASLADPRLS